LLSLSLSFLSFLCIRFLSTASSLLSARHTARLNTCMLAPQLSCSLLIAWQGHASTVGPANPAACTAITPSCACHELRSPFNNHNACHDATLAPLPRHRTIRSNQAQCQLREVGSTNDLSPTSFATGSHPAMPLPSSTPHNHLRPPGPTISIPTRSSSF
jgi:hypothetical protein